MWARYSFIIEGGSKLHLRHFHQWYRPRAFYWSFHEHSKELIFPVVIEYGRVHTKLNCKLAVLRTYMLVIQNACRQTLHNNWGVWAMLTPLDREWHLTIKLALCSSTLEEATIIMWHIQSFTVKHSGYKAATTGYQIVWVTCLNITSAPWPLSNQTTHTHAFYPT